MPVSSAQSSAKVSKMISLLRPTAVAGLVMINEKNCLRIKGQHCSNKLLRFAPMQLRKIKMEAIACASLDLKPSAGLKQAKKSN